MQKSIIVFLVMSVSTGVWAQPGQYQINQACLDVGCFSGDNPATKTVEITQSSGVFVLTSDLVFSDADNGSAAILVDAPLNNSGVIIDLNGYKIRHTGIASGATYGIEINGQNSIVTIKNGQINAFIDGLHAAAGVSVVVEDMVFRINRDDAVQAGMGIIRNNVFDANDFGINALNSSGGLAGDRLLVDSNLFIDDTGNQDTVFSFASSNYCKDNVVAYADAGQFAACTLSGANLCDTALCSNNRDLDGSKE